MTQEREKSKPIQIRVTQEQLDALKAMARAEHRSLASFILWYILYRKGETK